MAKSIADKIDIGMILLDVMPEEKSKIENIVENLGCAMPNVKMSIYKNRRGQYNRCFLWMLADKGTCRFNTMFVTDYNYELMSIKETDITVVKQKKKRVKMYSKEEVKELITLENVFTLLEYFNAEPEMYANYICALTICHGGDSKKLYYYENTQLFHCYSGNCETFDVFELVQKVQEDDDLNRSISFLVDFFNLHNDLSYFSLDGTQELEDYKVFSRYKKISEITPSENKKILLPEVDNNLLQYYPKPVILPWQQEGISKSVCDRMEICYDGRFGNILIPHRDENNRLIGIRQRTLIDENEQFGKYRPWKYNGTLYNHPLAFNLYGLNISKSNIQQMKTAIVFEGEKSVLKYASYFGFENNISVAVCGSSLSKYQFNLLYNLGITELVIAFDKDFTKIGTEDYNLVINKMYNIYQKYSAMIRISFLFDKKNNQLGYKSSPIDCGKENFLNLYKNRIVLQNRKQGV